MPDPHRLERELSELLARPQYANLFARRNQFRNPTHSADTPKTLAAQTTAWIMSNTPFEGPVTVEERHGGLEFYRVYDGISHQTALTLGRCWLERPVVESIWATTARWQGQAHADMFMDFLRSANFIHPQWNKMTDMAVMQVPAGAFVVVIRGKGTWKAMRSRPGAALSPNISSTFDVMNLHGSMPIPGTYQCVLPLYNDMWVRNVPKLAPTWPLVS
jgi:hypothetical protein